MGRTLYLGSLKSDVYFCIYEKDYEQYVKLGTPLEEADIINRFEIRLRNERAYYAVRDLLTYYDAEQTAFSIINQYVRFVDEEPDKRKNDWKLNDRWAWFIGDNRQSLKLTTKPEPYTLERTLRWVQRQVAPTLKMLKKIDKGNGTDYERITYLVSSLGYSQYLQFLIGKYMDLSQADEEREEREHEIYLEYPEYYEDEGILEEEEKWLEEFLNQLPKKKKEHFKQLIEKGQNY